MERTRSSRSAAAAALNATTASKKSVNKEKKSSASKKPATVITPTRPRRGEKRQHDSDDEEFFGFTNSDIPQPIIIKTEPVEEGGEDCVIVEVSKAAKPLSPTKIKKEKFDDDDTFHGFSMDDLPKPIVIKEEPVDNNVSAERATIPSSSVSKKIQSPVSRETKAHVPGDDILDEFASAKSPSKTVVKPSTQIGRAHV